MKNLHGLSISQNSIIALYEMPNGERIAEEHSRIGSPCLRRGTWQREDKKHFVQFATERLETEVSTVTEICERFRGSVVEQLPRADKFARALRGELLE